MGERVEQKSLFHKIGIGNHHSSLLIRLKDISCLLTPPLLRRRSHSSRRPTSPSGSCALRSWTPSTAASTNGSPTRPCTGTPTLGTAAYEVHGGILSKYVSLGGFGPDPTTGKRLLGFPRADEADSADRRCRVALFEWGAIYWIYGGVEVHGKLFDAYQKAGGETGRLGYPVADVGGKAGGEIAFFEFGCLWYGPLSDGEVVEFTWKFPQLGQPWIVKPSELGLRGGPVRDPARPGAGRAGRRRPVLVGAHAEGDRGRRRATGRAPGARDPDDHPERGAPVRAAFCARRRGPEGPPTVRPLPDAARPRTPRAGRPRDLRPGRLGELPVRPRVGRTREPAARRVRRRLERRRTGGQAARSTTSTTRSGSLSGTRTRVTSAGNSTSSS